VSDSLKRAAVHFGVGVSIYALPQVRIYMNKSFGWIEVRKAGQKDTIVLTEQGHIGLRDGYARWLENHGVPLFGEPLDHGDVEGAVFEEDEPAEEEFAPEPAAPLEDDEAVDLVERIKATYDRIREVDPKAVAPGKFNEWLRGAQHSHDELNRLRAYLGEREAAMTAEEAE
jgi:hypothetical protein